MPMAKAKYITKQSTLLIYHKNATNWKKKKPGNASVYSCTQWSI